ncbi:antitoxin Xre-like helix-turn-helix domain-containing protein [Ideonella sp. B508-1]|uniref:antitoxin Xre-like helix-turn-helix domain-containing protein n=1 Tax=Ideonella sp. B508-1 TaxID=137716 RepID=UPI0027E4487B|nr:antitoxin Xre-like helix-turn-helix domain-containing protein [Ideonella sp. B508-1]
MKYSTLAVSPPDPAAVLAKATARASALLGLKGVTLARTLGLSEPTVSRVLKARRAWRPIPRRASWPCCWCGCTARWMPWWAPTTRSAWPG